MSTVNPDPLMSTNEAAAYLSANPKTLINQRVNGEGAKYLKIGRLVRYRQSSLDKYLSDCEVKS